MQQLIQMVVGGIVPILIVALGISFLVAIKVVATRFKKIPPGQVGIFYGMKYRQADGTHKGFLVMSGGGRVLRPLLESYMEMSTSAFQVEIDENNIPNKDNVRLIVKGVATCKLSTVPEDLNKAAESFLGKSEKEIRDFIGNILKGHLRSIIGKLDIDTLLRQRDEFNKRVVDESSMELKHLGIEIINLVIQDINDSENYIDALGKRAVADAKAEAEIKVAEANRKKEIEVSNALREAALVRADNDAKIAEAEKDRDIKIANFKTAADTERAKAETAFNIAKAAQDQKLKVAEADRDAAEKEAQVKVQEKEALRRQKELDATLVAQAKADRDKATIDADAAKQKKVIEAQAEAEALKTTAEARKNAATLEGEGEAAATRAKLIAEAEGRAAAKKEALLAEAQGTEKLAEALAKMTQDARFIIILDKLPALLDKGGDALARALGPQGLAAVFESIAKPLGSVDSIHVIDLGGPHADSNGNGSAISKMTDIGPEIVFGLLTRAQALGFGPTLEKLGFTSELLKHLGSIGVNPGASDADKEKRGTATGNPEIG
jgi:flotillin